MLAGLIISWSRFEIEAKATIAVTRTGAAPEDGKSSASCACQSTTDQSTPFLETTASVTASVEDFGSGGAERKWFVTLGAFISHEVTESGGGTPRSTLTFENLKVYEIELLGAPVWFVSWTQAAWKRDGVLDRNLGAGSFIRNHFAPSGVPILGIPAQLGGLASINPAALLGTIDDGSSVRSEQLVASAYNEVSSVVGNDVHELEDPLSDAIVAPYSLSAFRHSNGDNNAVTGSTAVDATANGGWRFKATPGGAFIAPAVTVNVAGFIGAPGPCDCSPGSPIVAGSSTFSLSVSSFAEEAALALDTQGERQSAVVWGFPAYTKSLRRMNSDYRVLLRRFAMLGAKRRQESTCGFSGPEICQVSLSSEFPLDVLATGGKTALSLNHFSIPIANYVNFNCSPLWSFFVDYPPNGSDQWKVAGIARNADIYWVPAREQLMFQESLPPEEKFKTRNSIVSEPLFNSLYATPFIDFTTGQITSWWGISRFDKMAYAIPGTFTYTSANSGRFTAVSDCSLAFGANITVTLDGGKTSCVVRLDLASFTADPFMLPQIAELFAVQWSDGSAAVVSVDVFLESPLGDKTLLTSVSSPTGVRRKDKFDDSKFAGSWGQNFGLNEVADTGLDVGADGESATVMADVNRNQAYQLLGGYGAKFLRFEIVVDTAGGTMNLEYPVLTMRTSTAEVVIENGLWGVLVWADGPGMRFTQWDWTNGINYVSPTVPLLAKFGVPGNPLFGKKSSITDALAFKHCVLEGNAPSQANVDADVAALYDTVEAPLQNFFDADDIDVHSFLVPDPTTPKTSRDDAGIFILVNSRREVPPAICLPVPARTVDYDQDLTDWGMTSLSFIKSPRELLYRSATLIELVNPADSTVWTTDVLIAPGWRSARHDHELNAPDNDEGATFEVTGSKVFATVSPWHGYTGVLEGGVAADPTNYTMPSGAYMRAHVIDGNIQFRYADWTVPEGGFDVSTEVTTTGDDSHPCIAHDPATGRIHLVFQREDPAGTFDAIQVTSDDAGATWSAEVSLGAWKYPRVSANRSGSLLFMGFKHNSGSSGPGKLFHRFQASGDASPSAELAIQDGVPADIDVADERFDIVDAKDSAGRWILVAREDGDPEVSEFHSFDEGKTWSVESSLGEWKYPRVAANRSGTLLFMGFKYISGSSGPGELFFRFQMAGDASPSAEAAITEGELLFPFADERFDIVDAKDSAGRWVLTGRKDGGTDVSELHSFDEGKTWEVI